MIEVKIERLSTDISLLRISLKQRENTGCLELLDYGKFNSEVNIDACSKIIEVTIERLSTDISLVEYQFKTEGEYWLFGVVILW